MEQYTNNQNINNQQFQAALEGIRQAVQGEREDELFYDYLISVAPTYEEKEIIGSIRDDERNHNKLFRWIYGDFTGIEIQSEGEENFEEPDSYVDGIKKALFGELKAVEKYRAIRRALPMGPLRDILFDIITDEIKHASKYNYLFTLNSGMNRSAMRPDTSKFTPDDWIEYITPLVNRGLKASKEDMSPEYLARKFILAGVLVGLGKNPEEAIQQVEEWEKNGTSELLVKSKMGKYMNS